jgi:hypothetical protein
MEPNFVMHRIQHLLMYPEFRPVLEEDMHVSNVTRYMDDLVSEHMPQNSQNLDPSVLLHAVAEACSGMVVPGDNHGVNSDNHASTDDRPVDSDDHDE